MANQDAPTGFRALRTLGGGQLATNPYEVDSSNAVAIGRQDLVSAEADGNATRSSADDGNIVMLDRALVCLLAWHSPVCRRCRLRPTDRYWPPNVRLAEN